MTPLTSNPHDLRASSTSSCVAMSGRPSPKAIRTGERDRREGTREMGQERGNEGQELGIGVRVRREGQERGTGGTRALGIRV